MQGHPPRLYRVGIPALVLAGIWLTGAAWWPTDSLTGTPTSSSATATPAVVTRVVRVEVTPTVTPTRPPAPWELTARADRIRPKTPTPTATATVPSMGHDETSGAMHEDGRDSHGA